MGLRQRILCAAFSVAALLCVLPARALASASEETILMDDDHLVFTTGDKAVTTLERIAALGVDRVKVSVVWSVIAPHATSTQHPKFDATNPAAYPAHVWDRYDLIAKAAPALGLKVYFELNPPAPAWATPKRHPAQGYAWSQTPNTKDYQDFVTAVARRYSGSYTLPGSQPDPPQALLGLPVSIPGVTRPASPGQPNVVPRVDYWGIWNEPNEAAWLNPQWNHISKTRTILTAPALYRGLVDSAWNALSATGHSGDTILIGETASRGWILPTPFIRALYCVSASRHPLRGQAARNATCPTSGNTRAFAAAHPGLFDTTGYAHHPYSFDVPPSAKPPFPGEVTLAKLRGFERTLNGIFGVYHRSRRGGIPLYLTEWGYKTNPPNPFVHTSQQQQALWLNQGEYMTFKQPYVRSLTQFLLVDDQPRAGAKPGTRQYWSTPDTGLLNLNLTPKPSYDSFRVPIWLPSPRHGRGVTVWGQLRPLDHSGVQQGVVQYRPNSHSGWTSTAVRATNPEGFFISHVSFPGRGEVRIALYDPHTRGIDYSRTVKIK